jgi:2'-5' RNA ligase
VAITVAVPLSADHTSAIHAIIGRLRVRTGIEEVSSPTPHLTLLVLLEAPSLREVDDTIATVAGASAPFTARARGFGAFADEDAQPVLYTPVVRGDALARLHRSLYDAFVELGARIDGHYGPDTWIPHVTICNQDLTPEHLGDLTRSLARDHMITWRLTVDHVARFGPGNDVVTFPLRARSGGPSPLDPAGAVSKTEHIAT